LAGLWGAFLALPHWRGEPGILDRIEAPLADLRFLIQGPRKPPDGVAIVAIDDETVREAGTFPLPRESRARVVDRLAALGAKVIALDLLFVDRDTPEGDRALADALRKAPSVLAAAAVFENQTQFAESGTDDDLAGIPLAQRLLLPIRTLAEAAAVGVVNVGTDQSGTPRHLPLLLRSTAGLDASFSLRAASLATGQDPVIDPAGIAIGTRMIRTDGGYALPLRFYGPRGTIPTLSASDVLADRIPRDAVEGKILVVGATVTGGGDVFPTPFDPVLPGVEVLATAISHLVANDGLLRNRTIRGVDSAVAVVLPVLLVLLLAWNRSALGLALAATIVLGWVGFASIAFFYGIWLSVALPLAAAIPAAIVFGAARLWFDRRRADRFALERGTLRRFQPPSLAARLARDPDFLSTPVRQQAALIFIDLSGFTGLSETLGPTETRDILKGFHDLVDDEAVQHHGLVACFMGDGAMILFGLPEPSPQDAQHAVEAVVGLTLRTTIWLASLPTLISSRIGFKIGAHYGTVVASRLGGGSHQHITAIGDTVNVASRLMEVAAANGMEAALSHALVQSAKTAPSVLESGILTGTIKAPIRGRSGRVAVWLWRHDRYVHAAEKPDSSPGHLI
jgi:adenylate cyclase